MVVLLFLPVWLAGWTVAIVAASKSSVENPGALLWLALAVPAWFGAVYAWLWLAMGKERLKINRQESVVARETGPVKVSKTYETGRVWDLRGASGYYGPTWAAIRFDYDGKVIRFGSFLEEDRAREVADRINAFLGRGDE